MDKFWNLSSLDFLIVDAKVVGRSSDKYHIHYKTKPCHVYQQSLCALRKEPPVKNGALMTEKFEIIKTRFVEVF